MDLCSFVCPTHSDSADVGVQGQITVINRHSVSTYVDLSDEAQLQAVK